MPDAAPASSSRKLAAIFAADVVGYSVMMTADEEGTVRKLKAIQAAVLPIIVEHGGRVISLTGDGVMAEFASAIRAVESALSVQRRIQESNAELGPEMLFRIGINIGDVIQEGTSLYGDGINIAARLETIATPGGICISAKVYEEVRDRISATFQDIGDQQLKNIPRPVRAFSCYRSSGASERLAVGDIDAPLAPPDKPSVAVLPFTNMSGDPEQEFVSDGVAEDVITALSHYPSLFVIARNSSFTYKGRAVDVKQVGRELGVRYVLEGSVRKAGNRIRVTAQLIEAGTSNHVWAERYDRDLADIFAVQDELTEALTTALAPAIADAELRRAMRKPPGSLDAWAAYQRGLWHLSKATPDDDATAEKFFKQAIDLDPTFAGGYSALALYQLQAAAIYQKLDLAERATLGRGIGPSGGRARWRRCGSPFMPRLGLASSRRR